MTKPRYALTIPNSGNFTLDSGTPINNNGSTDFFMAKFNSNGILQHSIACGGSGNDYVADIEWNGYALIAVGTFVGTINVGGLQLNGLSGSNMFVTNLNSSLVTQNGYSCNTSRAFSINDICFGYLGQLYVSGRISGSAQMGANPCENTAFLASMSTYGNYSSDVLKLGRGEITKIESLNETLFGLINFSGNTAFDNIPIAGTSRNTDVALFKLNGSSSSKLKWIKVLGDRSPEFSNNSIPYYYTSAYSLLIKSADEVLLTHRESAFASSKYVRLIVSKYME